MWQYLRVKSAARLGSERAANAGWWAMPAVGAICTLGGGSQFTSLISGFSGARDRQPKVKAKQSKIEVEMLSNRGKDGFFMVFPFWVELICI